jgi:hypothetical protein
MSDGHSDSARYSRFYRADLEARQRNEQDKLEKMCLVLSDETVIELDGVQLLFSEKYTKGLEKASVEMLSEDGSRMMNLTELVRTMIRKGIV